MSLSLYMQISVLSVTTLTPCCSLSSQFMACAGSPIPLRVELTNLWNLQAPSIFFSPPSTAPKLPLFFFNASGLKPKKGYRGCSKGHGRGCYQHFCEPVVTAGQHKWGCARTSLCILTSDRFRLCHLQLCGQIHVNSLMGTSVSSVHWPFVLYFNTCF